MIDFEKTIELYRDTILLDEEGDKGERYEKYELIVTLVDCYVKQLLLILLINGKMERFRNPIRFSVITIWQLPEQIIGT